MVVEPLGLAGGLCIMWQKSANMEEVDYNQRQHMNFKGKGADLSWHMSFICGHPNYKTRSMQWKGLNGYRKNISLSWMCLGDFNDTVSIAKKTSLKDTKNRRMRSFRAFLDEESLMDLGYKGCVYTSDNHRGDANVRKRLDRAMANLECMMLYQNAMVNVP